MRFSWPALVLLSSTTAAWAAPCEAPYTVDQLLNDMMVVEGHLRAGQNGDAARVGGTLEAGFACMEEVLPGVIVGRAIRAVGGGRIANGDPEGGQRWLRSAIMAEPTFDYGLEDLPLVHPVRDAYLAARETADVGEEPLTGRSLVEEGTVYLDGKKLKVASARANGQHFMQVDGTAVLSFVVEGNNFPEEALQGAPAVAASSKGGKSKGKKGKGAAVVTAGAAVASSGAKVAKAPKEAAPKPAKVAKAPKEAAPKPVKVAKAPKEAAPKVEKVAKAPKEAKTPKPEKVAKAPKAQSRSADDAVIPGIGAVTVIQRQRPKEKIPLIAGGGLMLIGGGGLYAVSLQRANLLRDSAISPGTKDLVGSTDDLKAQTSVINLMATASIAALAVGSGSLTWGIAVHGGGALPQLHLRF